MNKNYINGKLDFLLFAAPVCVYMILDERYKAKMT